jgi:hypothetical protein
MNQSVYSLEKQTFRTLNQMEVKPSIMERNQPTGRETVRPQFAQPGPGGSLDAKFSMMSI